MIGQTLESTPRTPWAAGFFFILAMALTALAVALGNLHWAIGAVLPSLVAVALLWARDRAFVATFAADTLEVKEPALSIPYGNLEGLRGKGRPSNPRKAMPRHFPIEVLHTEGSLQIPAHLNVPSEEIYQFLYGQFSWSGSRQVNDLLLDYLQRQIATFGPERVWSYRARAHLGARRDGRQALAVSGAILSTGATWFVLGFLGKPFLGWLTAGLVIGLFGLLFCLVAFSRAQVVGRRIKNWQHASLVISPLGLALVQGDLKGEMRWDELRDVKFQPKRRSFELSYGSSLAGIVLVFEGARLAIASIYDRPLSLIHRRILQYWR